MTLTDLLIAWLIVSLPAALLVGAAIRAMGVEDGDMPAPNTADAACSNKNLSGNALQ